jgi:hypothetical protein
MSVLTTFSRRKTLEVGVLLRLMANQSPTLRLNLLGLHYFGDEGEATFDGSVLPVRWEQQGEDDTATRQPVISREEWVEGWLPS